MQLKGKRKGFTVIEALIAIGVFGIGVLAFLSFYAFSSQGVRLSRQITTASNLAQGLIEEINSKGYDVIEIGSGSQEPYSIDPNSPFSGFKKQISVLLVDENLAETSTDVGLKKIDVHIYWQASGQTRDVHIATIISQR